MNIHGLRRLHPASHANMFFAVSREQDNVTAQQEKEMYDYYISCLINRSDSILEATPRVVEIYRECKKESDKLHKEEAEYDRELKKASPRINGRSFDGLQTSMGTAWNIKKKKVSKKYVSEQRKKYSDVIDNGDTTL